MLAGSAGKTSNYKISFFWPTVGDKADFVMASQVGQWIGKNAKVLDKKLPCEVLKLVLEQFPTLQEIDAIHFNGPLARYRA
jgi:hypothetical protein